MVRFLLLASDELKFNGLKRSATVGDPHNLPHFLWLGRATGRTVPPFAFGGRRPLQLSSATAPAPRLPLPSNRLMSPPRTREGIR